MMHEFLLKWQSKCSLIETRVVLHILAKDWKEILRLPYNDSIVGDFTKIREDLQPKDVAFSQSKNKI